MSRKKARTTMGDVTPIVAAEQPTEVIQPTVESPDAAVAAEQPTALTRTLEEVLARAQAAEARANEAMAKAAQQEERANILEGALEQLRMAKAGEVEMSTTTTKPMWPFKCNSPLGEFEISAVDESEAKRLYCIKKRIDPSSVNITVECTDKKARGAAILKQYDGANDLARRMARGEVDTHRIPGVNIGV